MTFLLITTQLTKLRQRHPARTYSSPAHHTQSSVLHHGLASLSFHLHHFQSIATKHSVTLAHHVQWNMGDLGFVAIHQRWCRSNRGVQKVRRSKLEAHLPHLGGATPSCRHKLWPELQHVRVMKIGKEEQSQVIEIERSNPKGKNGRNRTRTAGRMAWRQLEGGSLVADGGFGCRCSVSAVGSREPERGERNRELEGANVLCV